MDRGVFEAGLFGADAALFTDKANTLYLTGYESTFGYVLLTATGRYYLTDDRYFEEAKLKIDGLYEVISVSRGSVNEVIRGLLKQDSAESVGFEDASVTYRGYTELSKELSGYKLIGVEDRLSALMSVKNQAGIESIRTASLINDRAFKSVLKAIKEGITERDLSAELEYRLKTEGGDGIAFDTIVAFGSNTSKPHAHAGSTKLKRGMAVTIDFGARFGGYSSDITRTFFFGKPSEYMLNLYGKVFEANRLGIAAVKANVPAAKVDAACRGYFKDCGFDRYFTHGTGHGVGVRIHEAPTLNDSSTETLKSGMVVTVEPGLYIPQLGGVRIEDLLLVTENGCEQLTVTDKNILIL